MNKKLKKEWVKALRSGDFKQGTNKLRDLNNNYCCIGVLCKVANIKARKSENGYRFDGLIATLSQHFSRQLKLSIHHQNRLIYMNDSENKTFEQIANWIEKNDKI